MARHRDSALDRAMILAAAFDLLDAAGLDGITMRALAARLGVQAPALYWHVNDKAELTSLMAQDLYQRGRIGLDACTSAQGWLLALGTGLRDVLSTHRDAGRLLAVAQPLSAPDEGQAQAMAAPLVAFGFGTEQALEAQAAVLSITLGWALYRENAAMADYLSGMFDLRHSFERGLKLLVEGLARDPLG